MKPFKKLSILSAALLMVTSMGFTYADEYEVTQIRSQDRERLEKNLVTPDSESAQARHREQKMHMNKNENEGVMEQSRTQKRSELNLEIPDSDYSQARSREQKREQQMVINKNAAKSEYNHEGDMEQTRTRTRKEFNLETATADFGQSRNREQHMIAFESNNPGQSQFKHMDQYQYGYAGESTMNRYMQGSSVSNQTNATRSMNNGRR